MSATDLVPLPADPSALDQYADPGAFVELACERAKEWLAQALEHGDIDGIVELKSQAEAIRTYTVQKQLGKDAELAAAEIVRRAERGIGLAIRRGQEAGEIRRQGEGGGARAPYERQGTTVAAHPHPETKKRSTSEYLMSGSDQDQTYAVTDGISNDEFEEVIAEAKAEGNLSRANVVRKAKKEPAKPKLPGVGNKRLNADRVVSETVTLLEGAASSVALIEPGEVTSDQIGSWVASLNQSLRSLRRFVTRLEEATRAQP